MGVVLMAGSFGWDETGRASGHSQKLPTAHRTLRSVAATERVVNLMRRRRS